jgi:hypothetical protein
MSKIRINPEDGGSKLFWNVGKYLPIYMAYPRKFESS